MSKRFHLGILNKNKHQKIKDLSISEIQSQYGDPDEGYIQISKLSKEVFNIGKILDEDSLKFFSSPAFSSTEVHTLVNNETAFYLINQEGFKALIENFRMQISNHFKELMNNAQNISNTKDQDEIISYIYFRHQEWSNDLNIKPYQLEGDSITNSSNLEYLIFDLLRIYKSINWKTQLITISAW